MRLSEIPAAEVEGENIEITQGKGSKKRCTLKIRFGCTMSFILFYPLASPLVWAGFRDFLVFTHWERGKGVSLGWERVRHLHPSWRLGRR